MTEEKKQELAGKLADVVMDEINKLTADRDAWKAKAEQAEARAVAWLIAESPSLYYLPEETAALHEDVAELRAAINGAESKNEDAP